MPTRDAYAIAALAVLIFFVAFNLQSGWVYAVDALLAGVVLVGLLSARHAVRGVRITRHLPAEAVEGEPVTVGLTLEARGTGRRAFLRVLDAVPGLSPVEVFIGAVAPGHPLRTSYVTTAVRRGTHYADTTVLSSGGLAGVFVARRAVAAPGEMTVYPRYWQLSRFPLAAWTPSVQAAGATRRRGGLEFYGLRDYRSGDSLRHVHWRSSARRGALMVREFEQELPGSLTLVIDTRPEVQAGSGAESTFEDLIRAAASIAWYVTSHGGAVRLLAATAAGPLDLTAGWRPVLRALADLRMEGDIPPARLLDAVGAGRMPVIALSPDPAAVAPLRASGTEVAAILADAASYDSRPAAGPARLDRAGSALCIIRKGDDLGLRLEQSA